MVSISVPGVRPFGVKLDGVVLTPRGPAPQRWVLWLNANGVVYEQILEFLARYAVDAGVGVLVFNYRGVARSTGWASTALELVDDAEAAMQYLLGTLGAQPENVVVHAHSIGGGVAAELARRYPAVGMVSDRSFSSLLAVVRMFMASGLNKIMGGLLGVYIASVLGCVQWAAQAGDLPGPLRLLQYKLLMACAGYALAGQTGVIDALAPRLVDMFGWPMPVFGVVEPSRTLVLFHRMDNVIHHRFCSLHIAMVAANVPPKDPGGRPRWLELTHQSPMPHMYPLTSGPQEWQAILSAVRQLFDRELQ